MKTLFCGLLLVSFLGVIGCSSAHKSIVGASLTLDASPNKYLWVVKEDMSYRVGNIISFVRSNQVYRYTNISDKLVFIKVGDGHSYRPVESFSPGQTLAFDHASEDVVAFLALDGSKTGVLKFCLWDESFVRAFSKESGLP
ncbi:hypothetical protein [Pseudodesulfovibrio pelocollis]|uniref:hypothetical protein n=1 Tax=Pseudodesulfovibrio pelocollis TaxID=3051432 RepID=UPI00255AC61F|nr:hypothetical protein [Pseudodesulfovibrio sp. SB368]